MASLARITQHAYTDPLITFRTGKALMDMADILGDLMSDQKRDITELVKIVRTDPDEAAAWVMAALVAIPASREAVKYLRDYAAAIMRYSRVGSNNE